MRLQPGFVGLQPGRVALQAEVALLCFGLQLRARRRDVLGNEEEEDDADENADGERTCSAEASDEAEQVRHNASCTTRTCTAHPRTTRTTHTLHSCTTALLRAPRDHLD